jgi:hypothetical protein
MAAKTLPVVVAGFATDVTTERTLMASGGVMAVIPPLVLAFIPAADRSGPDERRYEGLKARKERRRGRTA